MKNFRSYVIGLLLLPVFAVGGLFIIPGPDGMPLMNMKKLKQSIGTVDLDFSLIQKAKQTYYRIKDNLKTVEAKVPHSEVAKETPKFKEPTDAPPETIYKWRDKLGNLHYSNRLPPGSVDFEIVESE